MEDPLTPNPLSPGVPGARGARNLPHALQPAITDSRQVRRPRHIGGNTRRPQRRAPGALGRCRIGVDLELERNHPAEAIARLESAAPYELGGPPGGAVFWPIYIRGEAFLKTRDGVKAAAEYQKILDHRGESPLSALYPLAHLGLARAAALGGDAAKSRKAYQDFLALWKDADADLPILIEAKKEYERLK